MIPPGGGTTVKKVRAYVTSGDINPLPDTGGVWQQLIQADAATPFELAIAAKVGDDVEIGVHAMRGSQSNSAYVDVGVMVGTAIVRFLAGGSVTPGSEGDPGWYPQATFCTQSATRGFKVTSGDLDGGNVRFALVVKAAGAGVLYASPAVSGYPFYWCATNSGQNVTA
jgi:hypothetical protein